MPMMQDGQGRWMMRGRSMTGGQGGPGGMGPHMMLMMMATIDADLSGTLSLEEVQAVHARMLRHADADGDGALMMEALRAFMHGRGKPPGRQRRASGHPQPPEACAASEVTGMVGSVRGSGDGREAVRRLAGKPSTVPGR